MAKYTKSVGELGALYTAISENKTDTGGVERYPTAFLSIKRAQEVPVYDRGFDVPNWDIHKDIRDESARDEIWSNAGEEQAFDWYEKQKETPEMFYHLNPSVNTLTAAPSMKVAVPTLLGVALNENPGLKAPASLSKHSSRLVKRGLEAGAITAHPENPTGEVTNEIGFSSNQGQNRPPTEANLFPSERFIPDADVAAGRQTIKNLLGRGKLSSQFDAHSGEQMEFPQTEGKHYGKMEFK